VPELPEVEAIARALAPLITGRTILACRVIHPIATQPAGRAGRRAARAALARNARGATVERVERRGKYLLVKLDRGWLAFHFRMGGTLIWFAGGDPTGHLDVVFSFAPGALGFVDRRHLGRVRWLAKPEDSPGIAGVGIDPLSPAWTAGWFAAGLRRSRQPLKPWLMDQGHVAGLGNIYASEALWRAKLSPRRRASRVGPAEARRLARAIVTVLRAALECTLHPVPDLGNPDWSFPGLEKLLRVYGRKGEPCRRCGRPIRRIVQAGRGSYYCAGCQR
jgi:formamidopyrimidine-DNA glycosylase